MSGRLINFMLNPYLLALPVKWYYKLQLCYFTWNKHPKYTLVTLTIKWAKIKHPKYTLVALTIKRAKIKHPKYTLVALTIKRAKIKHPKYTLVALTIKREKIKNRCLGDHSAKRLTQYGDRAHLWVHAVYYIIILDVNWKILATWKAAAL